MCGIGGLVSKPEHLSHVRYLTSTRRFAVGAESHHRVVTQFIFASLSPVLLPRGLEGTPDTKMGTRNASYDGYKPLLLALQHSRFLS